MSRVSFAAFSFILCAGSAVAAPYGVNVLDYGAVPADNTKGTINSAAFTAALATGLPVWCDGQTYYSDKITVPAGATKLYGSCILVATGTIPAANGLINIGINGFELQGVNLSVAPATYPTSSGVTVIANDVHIEGVHVDGAYYGFLAMPSNRVSIKGSRFTGYSGYGIVGQTVTDFQVSENVISEGLAGSVHGVQVDGSDFKINNNRILGAKFFGISAHLSDHFIIADNIVENSIHEGINADQSSYGVISDNQVSFDATSIDYGISTYGTVGTHSRYIQIVGNSVNAPGNLGIALADYTEFSSVQANRVYEPNRTGGNVSTAACYAIGGAGAQKNEIAGNWCYATSNIAYLVTDRGAAGNNLIGYNFGSPSLGLDPVLASGSRAWDNTWLTWTPIYSASAGTVTSAATIRAYYKRAGTAVSGLLWLVVTNNGTGAGAFKFSIPIPASAGTPFGYATGRNLNSGLVLGATLGSATDYAVTTATGAYPFASGQHGEFSFSYDIQ